MNFQEGRSMGILKYKDLEEEQLIKNFHEMISYNIRQMQQCLITAGKMFYDKKKNKIGQDINFSHEFPDLVKRLKKNRITEILYRRGLVSPADYYEDLRHWFAPVGQDKLDIIAKDYETNEETPLNNYQEIY